MAERALGAANRIEQANRLYASRFGHGHLPASPAGRLAILTCMDSRIDAMQVFGLELGEAHILRNAGGRATPDAIRSLALSQNALGTREVVVVHHTDCGLVLMDNAQIRARIREQLGEEAGRAADAIDFLPITDLRESVRADVETLRSSPLLVRDMTVSGFIYDVRTGRLERVV